MGTTGETRPELSAAHAAALAASGLRPDVVAARGYWTANAAAEAELRRLGHSPAIVAHGPALMLPLWDVFGHIPFTVARPNVPRLDAKGKPRKYETPRGVQLTLDVHPFARAALLNASAPLWITEGQKKADAAVSAGGACAIALLGVWNWKKHAIPAWEAVTLRDRTLYLAFDSDACSNPKVAQALRRLKAFLGSRGAHVRVVHLEPGPDGRKVGLDDALAAGATLAELAGRSSEELRVVHDAKDPRPELDVSVLDLPVTLEAFPYLVKAGVYRTNGHLVRAVNDGGSWAVQPIAAPDIRGLLNRTVRCVRQGPNGAVPLYAPRDLAELIAHDPAPPVPVLRAVLGGPTFTADGRYLDRPGHDALSGLLLAFGWTPEPVPERPTAADVARARQLWDDEVLADFPFASNADHTGAMALALSPLVRDLVVGPTPLVAVDASVRASGKGLLVRVCLTPTLGPGGWTVAALAKEEAEQRKALTAYLTERRAAVLFDNVSGYVASAPLAKALTDTVWDDRVLGQSKSVRAPVHTTWALTANNATYGEDIARRVAPVRLVPQTDRPELRTKFRHESLEAWVLEHRAELVWALAVFVRAWQAAGCPDTKAPAFGSFESWRRVVGGVLECAGYPDFLRNRETVLAAADPDMGTWTEFVAGWWRAHGDQRVTVTNLLPLAVEHDVHINGDTDRTQVVSLGKALARRRDRYFGPYQVRQGTGSVRREWRLAPAAPDRSDRSDRSVSDNYAGDARARARTPLGNLSDLSDLSGDAETPPPTNGRRVLASGAVSRLVVDHDSLILEALDRSEVYARHPGSEATPSTCEALAAGLSPYHAAQRADLIRFAARLAP